MKSKLQTVFALVITLLVLLASCNGGSGSTLTPESIAKAETREQLAETLDCDVADLDNLLLYAKNLNKILPDSENESSEATSFESGETEDGIPWISKEEARTMITPILITTENWSEYFAPRTTTVEVSSFDEDGNETLVQEEDILFSLPEGYYYSWTNSSLLMKDNTTGEEFTFTDSWNCEFTCEDGKYYSTVYDIEGNPSTVEYSPENYTCLQADMILYQYEFKAPYLYGERLVGDETEYYPIEEGTEYDPDEAIVCINTGTKEDPDIWYCGVSAIGEVVYGE